MPFRVRNSHSSLVDKIRTLLAARGLTLAAIARKSRDDSSGGRWHHVPHNLYGAIRKRQFSLSLHQLATLSILSGYRFVDWLELFGFSLDDLPRLQAAFPALRTVELDTRVYRPSVRVPWFRDVGSPSFAGPLVPLSRWLAPAEPVNAEALASAKTTAFRFVKIGSQDDYAFPDLLPGSIVRFEPIANGQTEIPHGSTLRKKLFLVEHGHGLACSLLSRSDGNRLVLCSRHLPYASVELEEGTQARVLGLADIEVRRIVDIEKPTVPRTLGAYWTPVPLRQGPPPARNVGEFIQQARKRSGLSFREASKRTRVIAQKLRDPRYFCAPGSLSDCEARKSPPRHIHKAISICVVYFAKAAEFLEAAGVQLAALGQMPIPPRFLEQPQRGKKIHPASNSSKCMKEIERRFEQLPIFLHGAMPDFFGLPDLSVRDVFWAGAQQFAHPYLNRAAFLIVDRRKKIPRSSLSCPKWAQPIYIFLRRDGSYLCGSGTRSHETLIIHPCIAGLPKVLKLRNRKDAEVIGQIVGIVRRLQ